MDGRRQEISKDEVITRLNTFLIPSHCPWLVMLYKFLPTASVNGFCSSRSREDKSNMWGKWSILGTVILLAWPPATAAMIISRLDLGHGDSREEREWWHFSIPVPGRLWVKIVSRVLQLLQWCTSMDSIFREGLFCLCTFFLLRTYLALHTSIREHYVQKAFEHSLSCWIWDSCLQIFSK